MFDSIGTLEKICYITCPKSLVTSVKTTLTEKKVYVLNYEYLLSITSKDFAFRHSCDKYTTKTSDFKGAVLDFCLDKTAAAILALVKDELIKAIKNNHKICLLNFPKVLIINNLSVRKYYIFQQGLVDSNFEHIDNSFVCFKYTKKNINNMLSDRLNAKDLITAAPSADYVGLDISMTRTGVACLTQINGMNKILIGSFKSDAALDDFFRGQDAGNNLSPLLMRDEFDALYLTNIKLSKNIAVEGGALDAVHGAYRLGRYCGMIMQNLNCEDISEFSPTRIKKFITGYGRADKAAVARFVKAKLDISSSFELNDDESDALALLYCLLNKNAYVSLPSKSKRKKIR